MHPSRLDPAGLLDASPNPCLVLDRTLRVVGANRAFLAATGRELGDLVGRRMADALPADPDALDPDALGAAVASAERAVAAGQLDKGPCLRLTLPRQEGGVEERWWSLAHVPVADERGDVAFVLQHATDVTELERLRAGARRDRAALAASEAWLGALADYLPVAVVYQAETSVDLSERRFTYVSATSQPLMGVAAEEALVDPGIWLGRIHPEDLPRVLAAEREAVRTMGALDVVVRYGRPDGRTVVGRVVAKPRAQADGRLLWDGLLLDVTEAAEAEAALRASEARLSAVFAQASAGIAQVDLAGRFTAVNDRYCAIAGRSREELLRLRMQDLTHPDDLGCNLPLFEAVAAGGAPFEIEKRYVRPDGLAVWVRNSVSGVRGPGGAIESILAISIDITHRKRIEERLRESEERYRGIVEGADDFAIVTFDEAGVITGWNSGAERLLGFSEDEALGQPGDIFFTPEDRERGVADHEMNLAHSGGRALDERWHQRKDGSRFWGSGLMMRLDGQGGGYLKMFRDRTAEHEADAALRASEARYCTLFEAIDAGFCIVEMIDDAEGRPCDYRFLETNPAFERQAGLSGAVGMRMRELVPDHERHWFDIYGRVAATGEAVRVEEGSAALGKWWDVHAFRVGDPGQRRVAVLFNDISARRRAELALREINDSLETQVAERTAERDRVWRNSRDLLLVLDTEGVLRAVNPAWTAVLGWRADDLVGRSYLDLIHPNDHPLSRAMLATASHGDLPAHEIRCRHKDGSVRWISWVAAPEGDLIYASGRDVTAEKERQAQLEAAEAARQASDALYRAYFQNTAEGLFVIAVLPDGGFSIEEVNPAHQAILGFDVVQRGQRLEEQLPPEVAAVVAANYRRVVETGEVQRYRESAEVAGRVFHSETVLVPVRDAEGRITRIVGSGRDMTAQVQAEEVLRQSQKMDAMGQLTGGVAHDFNNLLTPILGALDRLQGRNLGTERDRRLIEGALQSAERARTLVHRLLAFARPQPLQPAAVDMAELVRGMADLVASTTGPQIDVVVELEPGLPSAMADANQLEMAILNLAVNARDAMPQGGTLRIAATAAGAAARPGGTGRDHPSGAAPGRPGRYVRLLVADTGIGMDEATRARAVEPFFSTKGVGRGTGLGLSMVHGLAAQLGGALSIRSQPGRGTEVELWLPVAEAGAETTVEAAPPELALDKGAAPRATGRVLLVDDEAQVRASTADMLAELGYDVIEAGSAEEALRLMDGGLAPDLLLTDHLMPGLSGTELARRARARRPDLPVLVVSGYAEAQGVAPDLPRLTKPFRQAELAASVAKARGG